jgi:hypothetical protein
MKKLILILALSLTTSVFASSLNYMQKVVNSEAVETLTLEANEEGYNQLLKVELTGTFRCPGCFEYTLTYGQYTMGGQVEMTKKVMTRMTSFPNGDLEVSIR